MDLSPLESEFTFGMNRFYLMFPRLGFHPTYYVAINDLVIEQCADDLAALTMPTFLSWRNRAHMPSSAERAIFLNSDYLSRFGFDPTTTVSESGTVTYVAMQLAFYMGFKKVVLIGVDHSFVSKGEANKTITSQGDDPNHFAPNYFGKGFRWQLPDLDTSDIFIIFSD